MWIIPKCLHFTSQNYLMCIIFFFIYEEKNNEACNSLNGVEPEPVPTRVLNPNASEANYKPKQRI